MNIVEYAKNELALLDDGSKEQQEINKDVMDIVKTFSGKEHSGFSASYALRLSTKLLDYRPLTPLTGEPYEWFDEGKGGYIQNKRYFYVFKRDNFVYDNNRFSWRYPHELGSYTGGGLAYRVEFPYMPQGNYAISLPKEDMTDDERYNYIKEHANDSDDMKDISDHLIKLYEDRK